MMHKRMSYARFWLSLITFIIANGTRALAEDIENEVVGPLDEGKTYRRVNEHRVTGKEIADVLVMQRWEDERGAFAEHILVGEAMEKSGLRISDAEVKEELQNMAITFARRNHFDPKLFNLDALARHLKYALAFLHEQTRTAMGLKKMLVREGVLKADAPLQHPETRKAMEERLKEMAKKEGVTFDEKKLGHNEVVRIGGRGYSHARLRQFIIDGIGPVTKTDLNHALDQLTMEYLLAEALKEQGRTGVTKQDRAFHFNYQVRFRELMQGEPDGKQAMVHLLKQQGITVKDFLDGRVASLDAGLTFLASKAIQEADLEAEWQRDPKAYQRKEKMMAHIFVCVRDPDGRPYGPDWQAIGHADLNSFVAKVREERFAEAKSRIERMLGAARGDFAAAAAKLSDDEGTKRSGGLIGRIRPNSLLPTLPIDQDFIQEALKLKPGEISEPLRSAYGWHLAKCLEKERQDTQYEEAKEQIYVSLLHKKRAEVYEGLLKAAKIEDLF